MRRITLILWFAVTSYSSFGADPDFRPIFNGKDLTGWDGDPTLWSVEDGCITGRTTGPEQLKTNQFLIWRGGAVKNFELRATLRVSANNSGIQYRSREFPEAGKWSVGGYQCDIHPGLPNHAMLYGEKWGGILALNGQRVIIDPEGKKWLIGEHPRMKADIKQWHDYTIIAQGNHLVHKIDGTVAIDVMDCGTKTQLLEGILAFQLHQGPAMVLQVKEVLLKDLPDGGVVAFDASTLPANAKPVEDRKKNAAAKPRTEAAAAPISAPSE